MFSFPVRLAGDKPLLLGHVVGSAILSPQFLLPCVGGGICRVPCWRLRQLRSVPGGPGVPHDAKPAGEGKAPKSAMRPYPALSFLLARRCMGERNSLLDSGLRHSLNQLQGRRKASMRVRQSGAGFRPTGWAPVSSVAWLSCQVALCRRMNRGGAHHLPPCPCSG